MRARRDGAGTPFRRPEPAVAERKTSIDRQLAAEKRSAAMSAKTTTGRVRRRLGWPLCALGVALFVATYVANLAGTVLLPFDPHHLIGQLGGGALAFIGLIWATT